MLDYQLDFAVPSAFDGPFDGGGVVCGTRDLALSDLSRVLTVSYVTAHSQSPLTATEAPKPPGS
jgi:hypothetical protein